MPWPDILTGQSKCLCLPVRWLGWVYLALEFRVFSIINCPARPPRKVGICSLPFLLQPHTAGSPGRALGNLWTNRLFSETANYLGLLQCIPGKERNREEKVSAHTRLDSLRGGGRVLRFGEPRRDTLLKKIPAIHWATEPMPDFPTCDCLLILGRSCVRPLLIKDPRSPSP